MADDKSNRGAADRSKVAAEEPYELSYFAKKHGLTNDDAREVLKRAGAGRPNADKEAERFKRNH